MGGEPFATALQVAAGCDKGADKAGLAKLTDTLSKDRVRIFSVAVCAGIPTDGLTGLVVALPCRTSNSSYFASATCWRC